MKMYQVYVCEKCGRESRDPDEIGLCEARHMGLNSLEELHTYQALKRAAEYHGCVVSNTNNERTREAFDKAIQKLVDFEVEHNMSIRM